MQTNISNTNIRLYAKERDDADFLSSYRDKFLFPQHQGKDVIYLCGNSLGLQPKNAIEYFVQELNDWAEYGVEGHFKS